MNLFISPPTPSPTLHLMLALIIQMVLGQMLVALANSLITFTNNRSKLKKVTSFHFEWVSVPYYILFPNDSLDQPISIVICDPLCSPDSCIIPPCPLLLIQLIIMGASLHVACYRHPFILCARPGL